MEVQVVTIGEAAQWEYEANGVVPNGFADGSKLFFAEVTRAGQKYTLYFDVSPNEPQDDATLTQWIIDNWDWSLSPK